jgi:eukaryotic-like serine/threonine-protein kinase
MRSKLLVTIAALWLAAPAICQNAAMFRGNLQHSGVYDAAGVPNLGGLKWQFHTGGMVIGSPAVIDGTAYVGSTDGNLYAIDTDSGSQRWKYEVKSRIVSSPTVSGGMVYFEAYDGNFYALNAAGGHLLWKFQTGGEHRFSAKHLHGVQPGAETMPDPFDAYLSSPAVWNGAAYFGSGDGNIYSLNAQTGELNWKFKTGDIVHASPAIADGMLFVGSWDSYFYALDAATGAQKWKFKTGEDPDTHNQVGIQSSASVADGIVYFGCRDSHLYAVDEQTGQQKWAMSMKGSWVVSSPAVRDGMIYFVTSDSSLLYALDAKTGEVKHSLGFDHWYLYSSPALAGGMLYVGSTQGKIVGVELASFKPVWSFETDGMKKHGPTYTKADGSPNQEAIYASDFYDDMVVGVERVMSMGAVISSPAVAGKIVYFGSADGNVYALR